MHLLNYRDILKVEVIMRNKLYAFLILSFLILLFGCANANKDDTDSGKGDNTSNSTDSPVTKDEQVLEVFNLVNEFRTGNEAFYLNEDNSTKTDLSGQLQKLILDDDLCKAANIRSKEIVQSFSHTRLDGTSCFTVLKDLSISYSAVGENIAAGNKSGRNTFIQWKEDDEDYNGQGHRRNMLGKNFTRIGIAYTYDPDSKYKYYWTMILAK